MPDNFDKFKQQLCECHADESVVSRLSQKQ